MDVAEQLHKIAVLLAHNGFVAILKQVTVTLVAPIVGLGIAGQKAPHQAG